MPTKVPATPDPALDAALERVWTLLADAVVDRRSALHQLVVATAGPDARTMVLRGSDRAAARLRFHSDRRADKAAVLRETPRVCVVGYDPVSAIQLRLHGEAAMATDGDEVDTSWAATSAFGRRSYMTVAPPGTVLAAAGAGLPDTPDDAVARANFAVVSVRLDRIEWLHLAHSGHRRAVHMFDGGGWSGRWLVP